jgi:hypothetical protein
MCTGAVRVGPVDELWLDLESAEERTRRRAARKLVAAYHDEQLRSLLARVREGFAAMDAGTLPPAGLDEVIAHYRRSAKKLDAFCGWSGSAWESAARTLRRMRMDDETIDWWDVGGERGEA